MCVTLRRLFAAAVLAIAPAAVQAAAPVPAANEKSESPMNTARKALDEVGDMNYQGRSLNDVIDDVKRKARVPVILDSTVYQFGLDPTQPVVTVNLKQVKLRDGLKSALAPFNLRCGLTSEGLFISTEDGVTARQLRQRVSLDCDGTDFGAAIKQLAGNTGANVVIDPRLGEKAKKAVTLKLDDVPLETAVRLLSEVADLRAVRMSNVLFVTTADRVKEKGLTDEGPTGTSPVNPVFPFGPGGPPGVIGGVGGFGVPVPAVDQPAFPPGFGPAGGPDRPVQPPPPPAQSAPGGAPTSTNPPAPPVPVGQPPAPPAVPPPPPGK